MVAEPQPPASHLDLLEQPLFARLATIRPDGAPQNSVMWFDWDGSRIRMTHTKSRQKYRNLREDPRIALSLADPDDQYRSLEVRGLVESIEDDSQASFYQSLQRRYGRQYPVKDAAERVVLVVRPTEYIAVAGGNLAASS